MLGTMVGFCLFDLYDRLLLGLAVLTGQFERAAQHAERALSIAERLGSPVWQARVQADVAAALDAQGKPTDAARAAALWAQARETAEKLGMDGLQRRCSTRLAATHRPRMRPAGPLRAASSLAVSLARQGEL